MWELSILWYILTLVIIFLVVLINGIQPQGRKLARLFFMSVPQIVAKHMEPWSDSNHVLPVYIVSTQYSHSTHYMRTLIWPMDLHWFWCRDILWPLKAISLGSGQTVKHGKSSLRFAYRTREGGSWRCQTQICYCWDGWCDLKVRVCHYRWNSSKLSFLAKKTHWILLLSTAGISDSVQYFFYRTTWFEFFSFSIKHLCWFQMVGCRSRGYSFTRALLGLAADELHLCGDPAAVPLIQEILKVTGDNVVVLHYFVKTFIIYMNLVLMLTNV